MLQLCFVVQYVNVNSLKLDNKHALTFERNSYFAIKKAKTVRVLFVYISVNTLAFIKTCVLYILLSVSNKICRYFLVLLTLLTLISTDIRNPKSKKHIPEHDKTRFIYYQDQCLSVKPQIL